ncbi:MAG TPA: hypothetical protein LFW14_02785 [Rickettsia endosymbiont of Degeeriella rufa]|nr:hypothetical protein [Rickettsia endosymbiont of Columbicola hoogstraali]HJD62492.1 hypothetical protein [Rickettsia endosymbiont of Degeeriella rufa]
MKKSLDNYFFDIVQKKLGINFKAKDLNNIIDSLIDLAVEHEEESTTNS